MATVAWLYFPTGTPDDVIAIYLMTTLRDLYFIVGFFVLLLLYFEMK